MTRTTDPYTQHYQLDNDGTIIGMHPTVLYDGMSKTEYELMKIREAVEGIKELLELLAQQGEADAPE